MYLGQVGLRGVEHFGQLGRVESSGTSSIPLLNSTNFPNLTFSFRLLNNPSFVVTFIAFSISSSAKVNVGVGGGVLRLRSIRFWLKVGELARKPFSPAKSSVSPPNGDVVVAVG